MKQPGNATKLSEALTNARMLDQENSQLRSENHRLKIQIRELQSQVTRLGFMVGRYKQKGDSV